MMVKSVPECSEDNKFYLKVLKSFKDLVDLNQSKMYLKEEICVA